MAKFAYDPEGRRVEKVAGGVTTSYVYDDADILRESRGGVTQKYVSGGIDELFSTEDGTSTSYVHQDAMGSVVATTNAGGSVLSAPDYDAWGVLRAGGSEPGHTFTGREWDPQTGMYYYRARYYDPAVGRFITEDPMRFRAGVNFFAYVSNNPTNRIDPLGLKDETSFPVEFCPNLKGGHVCCRNGRMTICLGSGPYTVATALCVIEHENYHAEQMECMNDNRCRKQPCDPLRVEEPGQEKECYANWVQYDCLTRHNQPGTAKDIKERARTMYRCNQRRTPWAGK